MPKLISVRPSRWFAATALSLSASLLALSPAVRADEAGAGLLAPAKRVTGSKVALLGDSLTVGAADIGRADVALEEAGFTFAWVDAAIGRTTPAGIEALKKRKKSFPQVLVVGLGTNDASSKVRAADYAQDVEDLMGVIGTSRRVIWLTVHLERTSQEAALVDQYNQVLREAARRHHNLSVAEWDGLIRYLPQLDSGDRIHLTTEGYELRAQFIANSVDAALNGRPVVRPRRAVSPIVVPKPSGKTATTTRPRATTRASTTTEPRSTTAAPSDVVASSTEPEVTISGSTRSTGAGPSTSQPGPTTSSLAPTSSRPSTSTSAGATTTVPVTTTAGPTTTVATTTTKVTTPGGSTSLPPVTTPVLP